ncbi:hypothetical protein MK292_10470, partial [Myxococcota bacterium]|nr:hypothetical protein [Myxococcota bacterium]
TVTGQDDFASMREVLGRRFRKISQQKKEKREYETSKVSTSAIDRASAGKVRESILPDEANI